MEEDFLRRVRRLYASVGEVDVKDLSRFPSSVGTAGLPGGVVESGGGQTPEELENLAWAIILNVAHLRDHARKFARLTGRDPAEVDRAVADSDALRIVLDLAERDKHGSDRRDGGRSGHNPRLGWLVRGVELGVPRPESVHITLGPSGLVAMPEGLLSIVLTGPILDSEGKTVGYLKDVIKQAVQAWEALFLEWGIIAGAA